MAKLEDLSFSLQFPLQFLFDWPMLCDRPPRRLQWPVGKNPSCFLRTHPPYDSRSRQKCPADNRPIRYLPAAIRLKAIGGEVALFFFQSRLFPGGKGSAASAYSGKSPAATKPSLSLRFCLSHIPARKTTRPRPLPPCPSNGSYGCVRGAWMSPSLATAAAPSKPTMKPTIGSSSAAASANCARPLSLFSRGTHFPIPTTVCVRAAVRYSGSSWRTATGKPPRRR